MLKVRVVAASLTPHKGHCLTGSGYSGHKGLGLGWPESKSRPNSLRAAELQHPGQEHERSEPLGPGEGPARTSHTRPLLAPARDSASCGPGPYSQNIDDTG
jgi:hypothetical protein